MKKVMLFGIFDGVPDSHESILREARSHGEYVIAVVAQDHIVKHMTGLYPTVNFADRFEKIKEDRRIDRVVIGNPGFNTWSSVEHYKPDVIVFAKDQRILKRDFESSIRTRTHKPRCVLLTSREKI